MSFDITKLKKKNQQICLNPFGTGQCLSTRLCQWIERERVVSIPLEQGNVFRRSNHSIPYLFSSCLNPFGTGQCLSTGDGTKWLSRQSVSIPLEQGNVFRQWLVLAKLLVLHVSIPLEQGNVFRHDPDTDQMINYGSQSLWNRAMSFDS